MVVFFSARDRERLEATDKNLTELSADHKWLRDTVVKHNTRCERWQFWAATGFVVLALTIIGFLLQITVFKPYARGSDYVQHRSDFTSAIVGRPFRSQ